MSWFGIIQETEIKTRTVTSLATLQKKKKKKNH